MLPYIILLSPFILGLIFLIIQIIGFLNYKVPEELDGYYLQDWDNKKTINNFIKYRCDNYEFSLVTNFLFIPIYNYLWLLAIILCLLIAIFYKFIKNLDILISFVYKSINKS